MPQILPNGFYIIEAPLPSGYNFAVRRRLSESERQRRERDEDSTNDPTTCRGRTEQEAIAEFHHTKELEVANLRQLDSPDYMRGSFAAHIRMKAKVSGAIRCMR